MRIVIIGNGEDECEKANELIGKIYKDDPDTVIEKILKNIDTVYILCSKVRVVRL